jgi:hypothetical protein
VPGFADFVLERLPPPPARVLEVGCGREGGLVELLLSHGYDALGVDPEAPEGDRFLRADLRAADGGWDAVVAGRVLHHVDPLDPALDHLARLAPLVLVDEFAFDRIDADALEWYEAQHRILRASGREPPGPATIEEWRRRHPGLHPHETVLGGLRARYDEETLEWLPYLHRWLRGPSSEALEASLVGVGAIPALGYRFAGRRR